MVGNNLTEKQLQEIVDKTILYADKDGNGKISFQEFCDVSCLHYIIYLVGHIDIHIYIWSVFQVVGNMDVPSKMFVEIRPVPASSSAAAVAGTP